jgi:hypothetical protein
MTGLFLFCPNNPVETPEVEVVDALEDEVEAVAGLAVEDEEVGLEEETEAVDEVEEEVDLGFEEEEVEGLMRRRGLAP